MLPLSTSEGTGGRIKAVPEDFVVMEITGNGRILEPGRTYAAADLSESAVADGRFTTFVLQKREWNTVQALTAIAKKVGHGKKSIGYAGTKDRDAVTVQLASIFGVVPGQLSSVHLKDLSINGAWLSSGVEMGSNLGNAFDVTVSGVERPENASMVIKELGGMMPNYFDRQRFGSRLGNAKTGLAIMNGDFESAAMLILTDSAGETNEAAVSARKRLLEELDFRAALSYFPGYLKNERRMIEYLSAHEGDYAGALRRLPRGISLMFIHAVQSLIFNLEVERRVRHGDFESDLYCRANPYGFPDSGAITVEKGEFAVAPLVGYETDAGHITGERKGILDKLGLTRDSFRIRSMPELSMKGAFRTILAPVRNLSAEAREDRLRLSFSIPAGSYATVLVNEVTKADDLDLSMLS
ncbi:MAG: tRNA pseudouridine(13) synthase TruD [Candidatus Marsarchaeota archaeon]|nr:tRNA pseudouridine(13) synthase TruD [Candidatus Marsarchaeota archaeon]